MIVKNESAIITRLFDSIVSIIDTYCICDTGSTDNTVNIIEEYFNSKGIKGKIIKEPFKNFEYNRTISIQQCVGLSDYILLLDADMTLTINNFNKDDLDADVYSIIQGSANFYYYNVRIVRNVPDIKYKGVTHEYIDFPNIRTKKDIKKEDMFINDIGDGGAKSDKYERDIRLLLEGIKNEPNNVRYYFYLANSYYCIGDLNNAIKYYIERTKIGGWIQEVWYSYYRIGLSYNILKQYDKAIYYWLEGYNVYPDRLENIYEIVHHYRIKGNHMLALQFYNIAMTIVNNKNINIDEHLFLDYTVYNYKIYEEYLIFSYYCKNISRDTYKQLYIKLLNNKLVPQSLFSNILLNHKFYADNLEPKLKKINVNINNVYELSLGNIAPSIYSLNSSTPSTYSLNSSTSSIYSLNSSTSSTYSLNSSTPSIYSLNSSTPSIYSLNSSTPSIYSLNSSTPSIYSLENNLYVNVRYISYSIDSEGNYINKDKIITVNKMMIFSYDELNNNICDTNYKEFILKYDTTYDDYYIGLEDIRLFKYNDELWFNANRMVNGRLCIEHGKIDLLKECVISSFLDYDGATTNTEKNWITFIKNNEKYQIYKWHPLTICSYPQSPLSSNNTTKIEDYKKIETPRLFSIIRGSTNGVTIYGEKGAGEIWFICHLVSYESRRYYYHIIIVLDEESLTLKRYSNIFTITYKPVEYILGFTYDSKNKNFFISYSIMDKTSEIAMISYDDLESFFPTSNDVY
jgi:glycosyltransferase involved in cell wall biosynthesis